MRNWSSELFWFFTYSYSCIKTQNWLIWIFGGKVCVKVFSPKGAWNRPKLKLLKFCEKLTHGTFLILCMKSRNLSSFIKDLWIFFLSFRMNLVHHKDMLNEMIFLKKSCSGIAEPKCSKMDPPKIFKFYEKSTLNFFSDFFFIFDTGSCGFKSPQMAQSFMFLSFMASGSMIYFLFFAWSYSSL